MERRTLGRTRLEVSVLGFGCGAVGGLMVRGNPSDQERAVARALEVGINYFDTAAMYGNGESERNLGRVLKSLKPNLYLGTKVRVPAADRDQPEHQRDRMAAVCRGDLPGECEPIPLCRLGGLDRTGADVSGRPEQRPFRAERARPC